MQNKYLRIMMRIYFLMVGKTAADKASSAYPGIIKIVRCLIYGCLNLFFQNEEPYAEKK
jgi:hypothetical protein